MMQTVYVLVNENEDTVHAFTDESEMLDHVSDSVDLGIIHDKDIELDQFGDSTGSFTLRIDLSHMRYKIVEI